MRAASETTPKKSRSAANVHCATAAARSSSRPECHVRICAVCNDDESASLGVGADESDDPIVACDECGMTVHADCYGRSYVKQSVTKGGKCGPSLFRCALCAAGLSADDTPPCLLCGEANLQNRAMKATATEEDAHNGVETRPGGRGAASSASAAAAKKGAVGWAHLTCVLYIQGPFLYHDDEARRDGVAGIGYIEKKRWDLRCALCDARGLLADRGMKALAGVGVPSGLRSLISAIPHASINGAPMQCSNIGCSVPFHPLCGREAGWMLSAEPTAQDDVRLRGYCGAHSSDDHLRVQAIYESACTMCGRSDREDSSLLCDDCDGVFHMDCLTPPMTAIPEGQWYCPKCSKRRAVLGTVVELKSSSSSHRVGGRAAGPLGGSPGGGASGGKKGGGKTNNSSAARLRSERFVALSERILDAMPVPSALAVSDDEDEDEEEDVIHRSDSRRAVAALFGDEEKEGEEDDGDADSDDDGAAGAVRRPASAAARGKSSSASGAAGAAASGPGSRKRARQTTMEAAPGASSRLSGKSASAGGRKLLRAGSSLSSAAATSHTGSYTVSPASIWARGPLTLRDANAALADAPPTHVLQTASLLRSHVRMFPTWGAYARSGFSLLLFGFGAKSGVAEALAAHTAPSARLVIAHGSHPLCSVRPILEACRGGGGSSSSSSGGCGTTNSALSGGGEGGVIAEPKKRRGRPRKVTLPGGTSSSSGPPSSGAGGGRRGRGGRGRGRPRASARHDPTSSLYDPFDAAATAYDHDDNGNNSEEEEGMGGEEEESGYDGNGNEVIGGDDLEAAEGAHLSAAAAAGDGASLFASSLPSYSAIAGGSPARVTRGQASGGASAAIASPFSTAADTTAAGSFRIVRSSSSASPGIAAAAAAYGAAVGGGDGDSSGAWAEALACGDALVSSAASPQSHSRVWSGDKSAPTALDGNAGLTPGHTAAGSLFPSRGGGLIDAIRRTAKASGMDKVASAYSRQRSGVQLIKLRTGEYRRPTAEEMEEAADAAAAAQTASDAAWLSGTAYSSSCSGGAASSPSPSPSYAASIGSSYMYVEGGTVNDSACAPAFSFAPAPISTLLVIHGIDGAAFREPNSLRTLVGGLPLGTRIIGTVDHVSAALLFDETLMNRAQFVSIHTRVCAVGCVPREAFPYAVWGVSMLEHTFEYCWGMNTSTAAPPRCIHALNDDTRALCEIFYVCLMPDHHTLH